MAPPAQRGRTTHNKISELHLSDQLAKQHPVPKFSQSSSHCSPIHTSGFWVGKYEQVRAPEIDFKDFHRERVHSSSDSTASTTFSSTLLNYDHGRTWDTLAKPPSPKSYEGSQHNLLCEACLRPASINFIKCTYCNIVVHSDCVPVSYRSTGRNNEWSCWECIAEKKADRAYFAQLRSKTAAAILENEAARILTRFMLRTARLNRYHKEKVGARRIENLLRLNLVSNNATRKLFKVPMAVGIWEAQGLEPSVGKTFKAIVTALEHCSAGAGRGASISTNQLIQMYRYETRAVKIGTDGVATWNEEFVVPGVFQRCTFVVTVVEVAGDKHYILGQAALFLSEINTARPFQKHLALGEALPHLLPKSTAASHAVLEMSDSLSPHGMLNVRLSERSEKKGVAGAVLAPLPEIMLQMFETSDSDAGTSPYVPTHALKPEAKKEAKLYDYEDSSQEGGEEKDFVEAGLQVEVCQWWACLFEGILTLRTAEGDPMPLISLVVKLLEAIDVQEEPLALELRESSTKKFRMKFKTGAEKRKWKVLLHKCAQGQKHEA